MRNTLNLEDVLSQAKHGDSVYITMVSNQDNGIASYAEGILVFQMETGGEVYGGPPFKPAHMESGGNTLKMYFSDRSVSRDQPFSAEETEALGLTVSLGRGEDHNTISVTISVFGNSKKFNMERQGNLFVGLGPSLGKSAEAVYILAFTGVVNNPR